MKKAVVICPGRGTYNKPELGYLHRNFGDAELLAQLDAKRDALGQPTLSSLDGASRFAVSQHGRGDNASALIFAATLGDYLALNRDEIEVVAVTGNSMGWYSALTLAGAVSPENGFNVVNTMGSLMHSSMIGGQLIYPFVGKHWERDDDRKRELLSLVSEIDARPEHFLSLSIDLGGMLVLAGDEAGLAAFEAAVPPVQDRFPMRLGNHSAFHSALQTPTAENGRDLLPFSMFKQPQLPMIDGRGAIWWPGATDTETLWGYTLGHQVTETYDFTRAVGVSAQEFAPDVFIVAGPGTTLGGAVAQSLIQAGWMGMASKSDFQDIQSKSAMLISMGNNEQRAMVV